MKKQIKASLVSSLVSITLLSTLAAPTFAATQTKESTDNSSKETQTENTDKQSQTVMQKDPEIGPGYYSQEAINAYKHLNIASPFLSLYVSQANQAFLNKIKPGALAGKAKGVLPSITAAQAIIESGWGKYALGNNLFGIKWTGSGPYVTSTTKEYYGGAYHTVTARFRSYSSLSASIEDHTNFLFQNSRYHNLLFKTDYHQVARLLQQDGYATDPNYANSLINVIDSFGLASWDKESGSVLQESEKIVEIVYTPGYGVLGFNNSGKSISGSNYKFKDGTKWKTFGSKVINGEEMYLVGNNEYVPKRYTNHYDNGVITIHYTPNYGVNALRADGTQVAGSNKTFKTGTRWKIVSVKEINGEICYCVGNNEYIPKRYTQWGAGK
ncbi:MAG: glucosaminidase domain-containing protein [Lactobacillus sp.]|jgi:flagellum-specific peptidoglycan hydrolase FlgJ|nr:glucosaminidase domain-containing protein [Lactobacillus sp.]